MLKVAFCDDEKHYLKSMSNLIKIELEKMKIEYDIETFEDGISFLKDYKKEEESFDLIFLDIEMQEIDGITLAKRIREMDNEVTIVFLTVMEDRVYDTFGYNVFRFIKKTLDQDQIGKLFRECIQHTILVTSTYLFNLLDGVIKVKESEIVYFERSLRKFYMHTTRGQHRILIDKFEEILEIIGNNKCFQMPNRSILVNMRYVDEINKNNEVIVRYSDKAEALILSRGKRKVFYESFINYIK